MRLWLDHRPSYVDHRATRYCREDSIDRLAYRHLPSHLAIVENHWSSHLKTGSDLWSFQGTETFRLVRWTQQLAVTLKLLKSGCDGWWTGAESSDMRSPSVSARVCDCCCCKRKSIARSSAMRHEQKMRTLAGSDTGTSRKIEYSSLLNRGVVVVGYVEDAAGVGGGRLKGTGGAEKGAGSGFTDVAATGGGGCWRRRASFWSTRSLIFVRSSSLMARRA